MKRLSIRVSTAEGISLIVQKKAMSDNDYNDFCSQQCFNEYHGFQSIDWQSRSEYHKYTSKEWQLIVEELEKKSEQEKSEKDARRKEAKKIYEEIIDRIKDMCDIDIDNNGGQPT